MDYCLTKRVLPANRRRVRNLSSSICRLLQTLGEQSYSLYLLHVPVGVHLVCQLRPMKSSQLMNVLFDVGVLAACLVICSVFFRFVEVPAHRWAQNIGRGRSVSVV